ncbi:hypothetical protein [Rhodocyclus gracilis]|uniref:Uncharacterized protein n=1 Tax=Rhodocyclus tenuis TaxID=1066 RepID=A0A6L5JVD1_RHOTE|nr:hypothetical protein [Rhodocyclus gracilis]MQY51016.1 hypothetical protein [Rhodocyclus gracilis]
MHVNNDLRRRRTLSAWPAGVSALWLTAGLLSLTPTVALAHGEAVTPHRLPAIEVRGELPPLKAGVASLKFGEFFAMPVGPLGLEPSARLLALNGKTVRLVGYMVREEEPTAGRFLFSPLPVVLGDEDESLSDDLPPSTVTVHVQGAGTQTTPYIDGLLHLTGTLEVGAQEEADGRVSSVRLQLDAPLSRRLLRARPVVRAVAR